MRHFSILVITVALMGAQAAPVAAAQESQTWISGGRILQPVHMARVDEDAFMRRLSAPPRLERPPPASGPSYRVRSDYWPQVLPGRPGVRPPAEMEAAYYPETGLVRARQGEQDVWLALDQWQRAILDRYAALGEKGLLSEGPGIVDVLRAAAQSGEPIQVNAAGRGLTEAEAAKLWQSLDGISGRPFSIATDTGLSIPAEVPGSGTWLTFSLPEGRSIRLLFVEASGVLLDYTGERFYAVPSRWLEQVLGGEGNVAGDSLRPLQVPQDEGTGSAAWWVVMLAGGIALLGGAIYARRRWT